MSDDAINLGVEVGTLRIPMRAGSDFLGHIQLNEDFDPAESLELRFASGQVWEAVIVGPDATWHELAAVADLVPKGTEVELFWSDGSVSYAWAVGTVAR